jgi:hypothetical protein
MFTAYKLFCGTAMSSIILGITEAIFTTNLQVGILRHFFSKYNSDCHFKMQPDSPENIIGFFHSSTDHRRCTQCTCHTQIVFFNCLFHAFVYFSCIRNHIHTVFTKTIRHFFLVFRIIKFDCIICNIRQSSFPICHQTAKIFSASTIFQPFLSSQFYGIFCPATNKHC